MSSLGIDAFLWFLLIEACVVSPLWGVRRIRSLRRALERGDDRARLRVYRSVMVGEWTVTIGFLAWWLGMGRGWADLRLVPEATGWQWLAIGVGLALTGFVAWQTQRASRAPELFDELRQKLESVESIVPHSEPELRRFGWLSLTAGICEEILFRGLLMGALTPVVGLWPAVLASSLIFGLGHSYQGSGGVLRTGLLGLVMALVVVFSGSLYVAILMHFVVDLVQGHLFHRVVTFQGQPQALQHG